MQATDPDGVCTSIKARVLVVDRLSDSELWKGKGAVLDCHGYLGRLLVFTYMTVSGGNLERATKHYYRPKKVTIDELIHLCII